MEDFLVAGILTGDEDNKLVKEGILLNLLDDSRGQQNIISILKFYIFKRPINW